MAIADDPLPDLVRSLRSPLPDIRARAARALGKLGGLARDALPQLIAATADQDGSVREAAAQAVGAMGVEAIPHVVKLLAHEDKYVRRNAVWALGKLGPQARPALTDLCNSLKDPDPRTASGAAQALGNMGADGADAVAALTEAMRGTNIVLCRLAAKALSQVGRPALSALIAHVRHRDPFVRGEAALALGWMGPAASAAVPTLVEALRPTKPTAWQPEPTPPGVSAKTPTTSIIPTQPVGGAPEDACRAYVAQALGRIGPAAATAAPALTQAARDPCDQVRQSAKLALKQIQG